MSRAVVTCSLVTDGSAPSDLPFGSFADRTVYVVDVAGAKDRHDDRKRRERDDRVDKTVVRDETLFPDPCAKPGVPAIRDGQAVDQGEPGPAGDGDHDFKRHGRSPVGTE